MHFSDFTLEEGRILYLQLHTVEDDAQAWESPVLAQYKITAPVPEDLHIQDLDPGMYALRGYVDINGNGELDMNKKGRPSEPFGFSYRLNKKKPGLRFKRAILNLEAKGGEGAFSILAAPGCKHKVGDCKL